MAARKRVALRHEEQIDEIFAGSSASSPPRSAAVEEKGDGPSIALLMVLYTLQGLPMGLSAAVPLLLAGKINYKDQAVREAMTSVTGRKKSSSEEHVLAMASMPFSLKLLWAPLVDAAYVPAVGRRKTWVVPCQLLVGGLMISSRAFLDEWMGVEPHAQNLAGFFFVLYTLCATQDIAVDGWALTMLSPRNVGWASTCNSAGQSLGFALSYVGFVALNDEATCNKYLRTEPAVGGVVTVAGFMTAVGWIFVATTVVVAALKSEPFEKRDEANKEEGATYAAWSELRRSYVRCARTLTIRPVQLLCAVLVCAKFGFAAMDAAVALRCVELGMPKDDIAFLSPVLLVISIALPISLARFTSGPKPLSLYLAAIPLRLALNVAAAHVLTVVQDAYAAPGPRHQRNRTYSHTYAFVAYAALAVTRECASNLMFVAQMAFFAKIVDPEYGGTDLTLLNTVSNLGGMWPPSVALYGLDVLPKLLPAFDALTLELGLCTLAGLAFLLVATPTVIKLQSLPIDHWRLKN